MYLMEINSTQPAQDRVLLYQMADPDGLFALQGSSDRLDTYISQMERLLQFLDQLEMLARRRFPDLFEGVQVVSLTALVTAAQGIELSYDAEEYAEYRALLATPASFAEGDESRNRNQLLAVLYYGLLRPRGDARTKAVLFQVVEIEVCKLIRYREILERLAGFSTVPAQTGQLNEEQRRDVVVILDRLRVYLARP